MTKENEIPAFASDVASAYWDSIKAENGDAVDINAVVGTGTNGAIKKGDIDTYLEDLTEKVDAKLDGAPEGDNADDEGDAPELEGVSLVNLTKNSFEIEGVSIEPEGRVEYTDALKKSERCKHAIENGVLGVE